MVAIPWKFESSYAHHFGVVAQLIERYVRIVEVVGLSPISSTKFLISLRGYGGMVDAEDLKSFGHCDRVGSSPTIPTTNKKNARLGAFFLNFVIARSEPLTFSLRFHAGCWQVISNTG